MDKTLFKEYEEWCVKENKDPLKEETIREFKLYKEELEKEKLDDSKAKKKAELVEKQKEIFRLMTEYVGVKVEYDEDEKRDLFRALDDFIKAIVSAVAITCGSDEINKTLNEILG